MAWFGAMLRGSVHGPVCMEWSGTTVSLAVLLVLFPEPLVFAGPSVAGSIGCYGALVSRSMELTDPLHYDLWTPWCPDVPGPKSIILACDPIGMLLMGRTPDGSAIE